MLDTEYSYWFHQANIFIAAVDNHPARRGLIYAAQRFNKPLLIMANEYSTSQALLYLPWLDHEYPNLNPMARYPEIETSNFGSPISCQGDALDSTPQLAIANQVSASLGNLLLWRWYPYLFEEKEREKWLPVEYQSTLSKLETITLQDLVTQEPTYV